MNVISWYLIAMQAVLIYMDLATPMSGRPDSRIPRARTVRQ